MSTPTAFRRLRESSFLLTAAALLVGCLATPGLDSDPNGAESAPGSASDDEVRVGYGTQDRDEVTGAVSSIRAEDAGREVTSIMDLIEGRLPGVSVRRLGNGEVSIRVRGASSFMGGGEPLFVIDGRPVMTPASSALMAISPRDVVRIDVLKDAGATAIYGSRGANGVIVITTRR